jgi:hypothetical protein
MLGVSALGIRHGTLAWRQEGCANMQEKKARDASGGKRGCQRDRERGPVCSRRNDGPGVAATRERQSDALHSALCSDSRRRLWIQRGGEHPILALAWGRSFHHCIGGMFAPSTQARGPSLRPHSAGMLALQGGRGEARSAAASPGTSFRPRITGMCPPTFRSDVRSIRASRGRSLRPRSAGRRLRRHLDGMPLPPAHRGDARSAGTHRADARGSERGECGLNRRAQLLERGIDRLGLQSLPLR